MKTNFYPAKTPSYEEISSGFVGTIFNYNEERYILLTKETVGIYSHKFALKSKLLNKTGKILVIYHDTEKPHYVL